MELSARANQVRLNLGAGKQVLDGWVSVDLAGDPDIRADVRELPLPDDYADEIQAIHLFEHIYRWEADAVLAEWFRVLKPGGRLSLELPDLLKCCANILGGMGERAGLWGLYGNPEYLDPLMCHRWAYSFEELRRMMKQAGFPRPRIRPVQFHKKYRDMRVEAIKP